MADKDNNKKKDELADIQQVDVEPLTDADLDTVAGGGITPNSTGANSCCTSNVASACC